MAMKAVSCGSGGVQFIEDDIERGAKSVSYKEFLKEECAKLKPRKLFGKREEKRIIEDDYSAVSAQT